jgi:hypothetical protein
MLTDFGTSIACQRRSRRRSVDHRISAPFGFLGICNGIGMSAHGFTHV